MGDLPTASDNTTIREIDMIVGNYMQDVIPKMYKNYAKDANDLPIADYIVNHS